METIELNTIDLRFAHTRHKDSDAERRLLSSIAEHDIQEPLSVSACSDAGRYVLLDGFKRYRCAGKLDMNIIPVQCIAHDVPDGVIMLLRRTSASVLSTMEQAALIEELHKRYSLSIYDIALRLERSPSWVSMRLGLIEELSDLVRGKIMTGAFPARAYMYGIKGFTRVDTISKERIDAFVSAMSGKGLSTRNLNILSRAYFTGEIALQQLILAGNTRRALAMITGDAPKQSDERKDDPLYAYIRELKTIAITLNRIMTSGSGLSMETTAVRQDVNLWSGAILEHFDEFGTIIKELYDRSRPAVRSADAAPPGSEARCDSAAVAH